MKPLQLKIVKFRCPFCRKAFQSKDELDKHLKKNKVCRRKAAERIVISSVQLPCKICGKIFNREQNLRVHMKYHQDPKSWKFKCKHCEKTFPTKANLNQHLKHHELKLANQHLQRPRKTKPVEKVTKPSEYKCHICGGTYKSRKTLRVHMQHLHKRKEDYTDKCNECGDMFPSPAELRRHMATHLETEGYSDECPKCGRKFMDLSKLKYHLYFKVCDGTFKCDTCGEHFQDASGVSTHKRFGCKNFKCPHCSKPFLIRSHLTLHIRKLHSFNVQRKYPCGECGKQFGAPSLLKRHEKVHMKKLTQKVINNKTPVKCGICLKSTRGYQFFEHVVKCHEFLIKQNDPSALDAMTDCGICGIKIEAKLYAAHVHLDLDNHYRHPRNLEVGSCTMCPFKARSNASLMIHRLAHEQSHENWIRATTCTDCRKLSSYFDPPEAKHNMNCKHLKIIQNEKKKALKEKKKKKQKSLQEENGTGGAPQYCCGHCNAVDESRIQMQKHNAEAHKIGIAPGIKENDRDGAFRCFICNKGWSSYEDCRSHLHLCMDKYATKAQPQEKIPQPAGPGELALYCCGTCDEIEPSRVKMQLHNEEKHKIGISPGVKESDRDGAFRCFICNKGWSSYEDCRSHLHLCMDRYTTKEPPQKKTTQGFPLYCCGVCDKTDQSRKIMELHSAREHGVFILSIDVLPEGESRGQYLCFICGQGYPTLGECQRHLISCMEKHSTMKNDVILGDRICKINPHKWGVVEYKLDKKKKPPVACFPLNRVIDLKRFL